MTLTTGGISYRHTCLWSSEGVRRKTKKKHFARTYGGDKTQRPTFRSTFYWRSFAVFHCMYLGDIYVFTRQHIYMPCRISLPVSSDENMSCFGLRRPFALYTRGGLPRSSGCPRISRIPTYVELCITDARVRTGSPFWPHDDSSPAGCTIISTSYRMTPISCSNWAVPRVAAIPLRDAFFVGYSCYI